MVVLGGEGVPVTVPTQEISARSQEARAKVVTLFVDWTLKNPDVANALSAHQLAPEQDKSYAGIGVSRKTLRRWFPAAQCGGSTWHALCYMAVEHLSLYDPPTSAPKFVRACAGTYADWLDKWQARGTTAALDWQALSDRELMATNFIDGHADLEVLTEVVRSRIERLHDDLSTTSAFGAVKVRQQEALLAADTILAMADPTIRRIHRARDLASLPAKRNCVPIIEAAVDARRLRSRLPAKEGDEFGLLLDLRNMGLDITRNVMSAPDLALHEYHRDMVRALLSHDVSAALDGEITATERLLDELASFGVRVQGEAPRRPRRSRQPHVTIDADKLVFPVVNIASNLVVHPEDDGLHHRAQECARRILKLYVGSAAKADRTDAEELLGTAQLRTIDDMAKPVAALRIVKFRGVGEVLMARRLVHAATSVDTGNRLRDDIRVYLGEGADEQRVRSALLLRRAVGLYMRSAAWLRKRGVSGALREIAISEGREAEQSLLALDVSKEIEPTDPANAAHNAIMKMRANLDQMIVDGLLEAHLNSFADLQDREAKEAAADLAAALNEAVRYIRHPELGLRTDLPLFEVPPEDRPLRQDA